MGSCDPRTASSEAVPSCSMQGDKKSPQLAAVSGLKRVEKVDQGVSLAMCESFAWRRAKSIALPKGMLQKAADGRAHC